jgi:cell cycle serine/threonine-protein kinase CDC5/MSD2
MTRWTLSEVMAQALRLASSPTLAASMEPDQLKFHQRLMDKLKYCKEVLASIKTASVNCGGEEEGGEQIPGLGLGSSLGIPSKASKASLR